MRLVFKFVIAVPFFFIAVISSNGQSNSVSIGTSTTHPSAVLWLESSSGNQGFVIPVGNRANVSAPAKGMLIFDTDQIYFHDGSAWNAISGSASSGKTYTLSVNANNQLVLSDGANNVATSIPIAGDVTGTTLGNTTVSRILGKQISIANFPSTGTQNLVYDGASGTWKLQAGSSSSVPTLSNGQILTGDGTTNSATQLTGDASLAVGVLKVTGLHGTALPALSSASSTLNILSYNATSSKWEFKDPTGANLMLKGTYDPTGKASDVFDLTNHSGVLPLAKGGTGISNSSPGNNKILSTDGTGTVSWAALSGDVSLASGVATVKQLNGKPLPAFAAGVLTSDASGNLSWAPSAGTGTVTSITGGTGLTGGTISTSGTLAVDVGTNANQIPQLDNTGKLNVAVLPAAVPLLTAGKLATSVLPTTVVQLDVNGKLPAVDGSQLTNLPAGTETDPTVKAINGIVKSNGTTIGAVVSGTDIKTINSTSLLGSGNITVVATETDPTVKAISGIVKSNGTTISAATPGTDYLPISGGSSVTTLGTITTGTWNGTKISEAFGGTNQTTYATGDILYASAANTLSKLGIGGSGQVLTVNAGIPSWQTVTGTGTVTNVAGTAPISVVTGTTTPVISIAQANGTTNGYLSSTDWTTFNNKQGTISLTTTGSSGASSFTSNTLNIPTYTLAGLGGISLTSLSATAPLNYNSATGGFSIANAAADGTTKGAASFTTNDFDATSGNISLDYANGQTASSTTKGFLTSADWTTFNSKQGAITLTTTGTSGAATLVGNTLNVPNYAGTTYAAGTGLTLTTNTFSVNTSQNITTLSNLTSKGLVTTTAAGALGSTQGTGFLKDNGTGTISYDNSTYLTANQTITLSGDVTGSGATAITTAIGSGKVTNTMLAGSIAASKLIGTDINTVGTITSGIWNGTKISEAYGGTNQTAYAIGDILYASASNTLSKLGIGTAGQVLTISGGVPSWQTATSGWSLGGNTGTVDGIIGTGTNYIGTKDNVPLNFMVNNSKAGRIEQTISGSTFLGWSSGNSNTGGQNAAFGSQALEKNTTGGANAAFGQLALNNNTTASYNVAVGALAMTSNTTGGNNIAVGVQANNSNTIGNFNTAIGYNTNYSNISSNDNTGIGGEALFNNTGTGNTGVGRAALFGNGGGTNNTAIGFGADLSAGGLTNATAIGANAKVSASNTIQLGDANVTTVNVGTSTTAKLVAGGLQVTGGTLAAGNVLTSDASGNAVWQAAGAGSGWSLTGNGTTVAGTNFVGTTNDISLTFKVNNQRSGFIDNSTGSNNTLLGYQAGNAITTGTSNSFFGFQAGKPTTTGSNNSAFGKFAMTNNIAGTDNAVLGYHAMMNSTNAGSNTALGRSALFTLSFANGGTAYSTNNTGVGYQALYNTNPTSTSDGKLNTSVGYNSGQTNTTGSDNTFVGASADASSGTLTNATAIGAQAYVGSSNSVVLGSVNGVNGATATVNVGIGTTTPTARLDVNGSVNVTGDVTIPAANHYKYATPKTKYMSIHNTQLLPDAASYFWDSSGSYSYISNGTAGTAGNARIPLNLPDGITITEVLLYLYDNDATYNISYILYRHTLSTGSFSSMGTAATAGVSASVQAISDTSISNATVDNSLYSYYIVIISNQANSNLRFYGARIKYTVSNAD